MGSDQRCNDGCCSELYRRSRGPSVRLTTEPQCRQADRTCGRVLCAASNRVPVSGFLSLVAQGASGPRLEVGTVGCEGMLGAELSLGVQHSPFHVLVQGAGEALRIGPAALAREMARSAALQLALSRYTGVTLSQLATSTACLRLHPASARTTSTTSGFKAPSRRSNAH